MNSDMNIRQIRRALARRPAPGQKGRQSRSIPKEHATYIFLRRKGTDTRHAAIGAYIIAHAAGKRGNELRASTAGRHGATEEAVGAGRPIPASPPIKRPRRVVRAVQEEPVACEVVVEVES